MPAVKRSESPVETIKRASNHIRGDLARELDDGAPNVSNEAAQLLKFHGIFSQDHRYLRRARARSQVTPLSTSSWSGWRSRGGRLTADQWLSLDRVAGELADGSVRLTTRQAVQFHGVSKLDLRSLARQLDAHLMTSFGACGDVVRNVVSCRTIDGHVRVGKVSKLADRLSRAFKSTSNARWEICSG